MLGVTLHETTEWQHSQTSHRFSFFIFLTPRLAGAASHKRHYSRYPSARSLSPFSLPIWQLLPTPQAAEVLPCQLGHAAFQHQHSKFPRRHSPQSKGPLAPFSLSQQSLCAGMAFPGVWVKMVWWENRVNPSGSCGLVVTHTHMPVLLPG